MSHLCVHARESTFKKCCKELESRYSKRFFLTTTKYQYVHADACINRKKTVLRNVNSLMNVRYSNSWISIFVYSTWGGVRTVVCHHCTHFPIRAHCLSTWWCALHLSTVTLECALCGVLKNCCAQAHRRERQHLLKCCNMKWSSSLVSYAK